LCSCFFFQAEDGIRDFHVTGVQTCALPISFGTISAPSYLIQGSNYFSVGDALGALDASISQIDQRLTEVEAGAGGGDGGSGNARSEERRVGKECRSGGGAGQ